MQRPYIFGILQQIRQICLSGTPVLIHIWNVALSSATTQNFLCGKSSAGDKWYWSELAWNQPCSCLLHPDGSQEGWGYPKAHLHPQYSSWALTCISQHAHTQVLWWQEGLCLIDTLFIHFIITLAALNLCFSKFGGLVLNILFDMVFFQYESLQCWQGLKFCSICTIFSFPHSSANFGSCCLVQWM